MVGKNDSVNAVAQDEEQSINVECSGRDADAVLRSLGVPKAAVVRHLEDGYGVIGVIDADPILKELRDLPADAVPGKDHPGGLVTKQDAVDVVLRLIDGIESPWCRARRA